MLGRPQLANGDTIPYAYGLRLDTYRGLRTIERGGHADGTRTIIMRFRDHGFTVAALCNADHLNSQQLAEGVADIYLADRMSPVRPHPPTPIAVTIPAAEVARYAGLYRPVDQPWNVFPIVVRNGALGELVFHDATDDTLFTLTPAGRRRTVLRDRVHRERGGVHLPVGARRRVSSPGDFLERCVARDARARRGCGRLAPICHCIAGVCGHMVQSRSRCRLVARAP